MCKYAWPHYDEKTRVYLYSLQIRDLMNRTPNEAVDIFRRLLWAESNREGITRNVIDVPDCINVGDGGLDAVIYDAESIFGDVIPKGTSGYQIKASNLSPKECAKELHQQDDLEKPLKEGVKEILQKDGTYVLVLYADITAIHKKQREKSILEDLKRQGYEQARVRVYTISCLVGFIQRHMALIAYLKPQLLDCVPYEKWAQNNDVNKPKYFESDASRSTIIASIQDVLRNRRERSTILRVVGQSGLGKTRVVFHALSEHDLKNRAVYVTSENFKRSQLPNALKVESELNAILVIDACSLEDHERYENMLSGLGSRIAIITVSHEMTKPTLSTILHELKPMQRDQIHQMLASELKGILPPTLDRLVSFVDGYPKFAILLIEYYTANKQSLPDDLLTINFGALMDRIIAGTIDTKSDQFTKTKRVLTGISLLEKLGYKGELAVEAKWVATTVGVDWQNFVEIVHEQKQRGIVQGENFIFVTPYALVLYLLRDWWKPRGDKVDLKEFVESMPRENQGDMFERLIARLPDAATTDEGRKMIRELLSVKEGLFSDSRLLRTDVGARFFLKLAEADPVSALENLKASIGSWSGEQLESFREGRTAIILALELIAGWKTLFFDAAKLLLKLSEFENQEYINNATETFASLFIPSSGIGPTELPPINRVAMLKSGLERGSDNVRKIVLRAFKASLQTRGVRISGNYYSGRMPPKFWIPESQKEIQDYFLEVWNLLDANIGRYTEEINNEIASILLESGRSLVSLDESLGQTVQATYRKMVSYAWIDKSKIIAAVTGIVHYEAKRFSPTLLKEWKSLNEELTGTGFSNNLRRYVKSDFFEDFFQEGEEHNSKWIESKLKELALEAKKQPQLLEQEYSWLLTGEATRGYQFGYELGKVDENFAFLDILIERQTQKDSKSSPLLGGYFKAVFERDMPLWEERIISLSNNDDFKKSIPELIYLSGMTDAVAKRMLEMLWNRDFDVQMMGRFIYGGAVRYIPQDILEQILETLGRESTGVGAIIALQFIYFYFIHHNDKRLPEEITLGILLNDVFWGNSSGIQMGQMIEHDWKDVALRLVEQSERTRTIIADKILQFLGDSRTIAGGYGAEVSEILFEMTKRDPINIWKKISSYLGPPIDRRALFLRDLLRGANLSDKIPALLDYFHSELLWDWINEDISKRAEYFATFVPPVLFYSSGKLCVARELLVKYGSRKEVRDALTANYFSESFSGSVAAHYQGKKLSLEELMKKETDENVLKWIQECLVELDNRIEMFRIEEERFG